MSRSYISRRLSVSAGVLALCALSLAACGGEGSASTGGSDGKTVYMLLPNTTTVRFVTQDGPQFKAAMEQQLPGTKVVIQNAEGDPQKQVQQVETAVSGGASAIVLVAADPYIAGGALQQAAKAKVPVLLYDHDARGGEAAAQVVFDSLAVGQDQGKDAAEVLKDATASAPKTIARIYGNQGDFGTTEYKKGQDQYLQPLISSGKVKVACESYTQGWDPAKAQAQVEQCLTKTNNRLDAVVVMNDGTAGGAVAALKAQSLAGKVPVVGGQDAAVAVHPCGGRIAARLQGRAGGRAHRLRGQRDRGLRAVPGHPIEVRGEGAYGVPPLLVGEDDDHVRTQERAPIEGRSGRCRARSSAG